MAQAEASSKILDVLAAAETGPGTGRLRGAAFWVTLAMGLAGIMLAIHQTFHLQLFGILLLDTSYFYALLALFLSLAFLAYPATAGQADRVPWFDWALFALTIASMTYLAWNGGRIVTEGWDILAPPEATIVAGIVCLLVLEALRRAGGYVLFVLCALFFAYPLYAESMPGFLWGPSMPVEEVVRAHAMGVESIIGVPMRTVANLLIGFLLFGSALVVTGGGDFFMNLAMALLGRTRGGPAKVAVLSSGFFGSLSGSVISNVVTTGQVTIPTMKRIGYPANYAGAVEACASTGGALMPPVMGTVAFIMAEFLNVPYSTVMLSAVVPALLYYLVLIFQTDHYAAVHGLKGQPASEIPPLWPTLRSGWYFLFAIFLLTYLLLAMRVEEYAPYFATIVLVATAMLRRKNRFGLAAFRELVMDATRNIVNIVAILAGIGFIVGSLSYTGVGGAFSRELLQYAGGNVYLLLVFGAITSFILGMGMTSSACYIFLAVVLGPALIEGGLNPIASHLYILYWGIISFITPPVALAAIAAAAIAKGNAFATGVQAMRLGLINFFLPFLFVLNPTLILIGDPGAVLHDVATAVLAVWLLAAATEGWLYSIGRAGWLSRIVLFVAALGLLDPGWYTDLIGIGAAMFAYGFEFVRGRMGLRAPAGSTG